MNEIILHHYPESPFSEKIRLLLGFKRQSYSAVTIPIIMPKPDLMALTGGYRKTPVMQIGADIYCDTAIICRVIDRLVPEDSIYPTEMSAIATAVSHWTDTFFFRVCVAVAFQPKALVNSPLFSDPEAASAFMADRAQLNEGSTQLTMDAAVAVPYFHSHLVRMDNQLQEGGFLLGDKPSIVDFSTYHCCWFVRGNEALRDLFSNYPNVSSWMDRMSAFNRPELLTEITGEESLEIANKAAPSKISKAATSAIDELHVGDMVEVKPIDYGLQPTRGKLQLSSLEELVISRTDEKAGQLAVHFPRLGFQIAKVT
jgi:glutathione S-transferase